MATTVCRRPDTPARMSTWPPSRLRADPEPTPQAPASRYRVNVPLRWSDMDAYGHVNNVQFLRLLEDARVIGFEDWFGQDRSVLSEGILVARHEIEYLAPLLFRVPPIVVEMWATKIGGAGFDLAYEVRDGRATADGGEGDVVYARAETDAGPLRLRHQQAATDGPLAARGAPVALGRPGAVPLAAPLMELTFPDAQGLDDLRTYVARAKAADEDGAIRLQAPGTDPRRLRRGAARQRPDGRGGRHRAARHAAGRAGRARRHGARWPRSPTGSPARAAPTLALPPMTVQRRLGGDGATARSGGSASARSPPTSVYAVARQGIEEVASGAPADAGGAAVAALRKQVWGRLTTTTPPVPAGGAFAAYVLGFVRVAVPRRAQR